MCYRYGMKKEMKQRLVFWLSFVTAVLSVLALIGFVAAQAYIRWKLNQNFTFLGEAGIPSLAVLVVGLVSALAYIHRSDN
jgi:uncharacterized membrane-anchored protein